MPVIAVVNRKGGSGKSTLSAHLAARCAHQGHSVMLGDVDRQQSSRTWLKRRSPELPQIAPWAMDQKNVLRVPTGITTGIDLALHLVAQECGAPLASRVAQTMVVALRRGPQDPELSPFLAYRNHIHPALHRVQDAVSAQPHEDWSVPRMAEAGHTSTRHLTRLFVEHAGVAPLEYLRRIRLAVAQAALASGRNVTQAAELAGFSSDTQLRRAWHQFGLAGTPSAA